MALPSSFSNARRLGLIASLALLCAAPHRAVAQTAPKPAIETPSETASENTLEDAPETSPGVGPIANDPWEGFNRRTFKFNRGVDRVLIGPLGRGYMKVTPRVVRGRVSAFVANLAEPRTALNDLAQGRPRAAGVTTSRFVINTTVGGLGLFDVGGKLGLERHQGDFGQTLG
jgi:phospholipid-binding lipoprotein MlaA